MTRSGLFSASSLFFAFGLAGCVSGPESEAVRSEIQSGNIANLWDGTPTDEGLALAPRVSAQNPNRPSRWWAEVRQNPLSWFQSAEGVEMAENILSWQRPVGGWPLMNPTRERYRGDPSQAGPWGINAALVKSTVNEIRFLARGYRATEDERYREAVLRGVEFLLQAQYDTGGWPKKFPLVEDYTRYASFNDDEVTDILTLLLEMRQSPDFQWLDDDLKERVNEAYARGLQFVLESQVRVDGQLTAWAQQYDPDTLEPMPARAFELAGISGGESAGILHMLMSIRNPSEAVQASVHAGVQWYRDAAVHGIRPVRENGDTIVTEDASAPPVWARYYEIGTGRPMFAGRDGIVRYDVSEIEQERRGGYAWYNYSGNAVFERYDEWLNERRWDAQPPTNTDEALVGAYNLPEILVTDDGEAVSSVAEWETVRRPQIMSLLEQYQEGVTPDELPDMEVRVVERGAPAMDGIARRTQVRIMFPEAENSPEIRVMLHVPADADGPVPTVLYLGFTPNIMVMDEPGVDEGMAWSAFLEAPVPDREATRVGSFNARHFVERGYGIATVYYGDIYPDFDHGNRLGVTAMFPDASDRAQPDAWGATGAWAWGVSRVMDYLITDPAVDGAQVALAGVSRLGKSILWAGAQDERFAAVIPWLSGEGGAAISRRSYGETIADLTNPFRYDYWFAPRYQDYAFQVEDLPVDGHMLLSMIAPRPVLQIVGSEDTWSDPIGEFASAQAASPVWELYGLSGLGITEPLKMDDLHLGTMSFFLHDGGHTTLPQDFEAITDFLDHHFQR